MVEAKMSETGKCLPLFPGRHFPERSPTTRKSTDFSAVFHMSWPRGTPFAFTDVCEVQYASCNKP